MCAPTVASINFGPSHCSHGVQRKPLEVRANRLANSAYARETPIDRATHEIWCGCPLLPGCGLYALAYASGAARASLLPVAPVRLRSRHRPMARPYPFGAGAVALIAHPSYAPEECPPLRRHAVPADMHPGKKERRGLHLAFEHVSNCAGLINRLALGPPQALRVRIVPGQVVWPARFTRPRLRQPLARLLHSEAEACEALGISVHTLLGEVRAGRLRYVLVGKRRKYKPEDLMHYIKRQERGGCEDDETSQLRGLGRRTATQASPCTVVDFDTVSARLMRRKRR